MIIKPLINQRPPYSLPPWQILIPGNVSGENKYFPECILLPYFKLKTIVKDVHSNQWGGSFLTAWIALLDATYVKGFGINGNLLH